MKTILYAVAAMMIATSAANAASTVSERAGGQTAPTAQGERDPRPSLGLAHDAHPVMLQREMDGLANPPSPTNTGAGFRNWTGNDNEG